MIIIIKKDKLKNNTTKGNVKEVDALVDVYVLSCRSLIAVDGPCWGGLFPPSAFSVQK